MEFWLYWFFYLYSCIVIVIVHVTIVLLIDLFSRFGYYFNKHLLTYLLTYIAIIQSSKKLLVVFSSNVPAFAFVFIALSWEWHLTCKKSTAAKI